MKNIILLTLILLLINCAKPKKELAEIHIEMDTIQPISSELIGKYIDKNTRTIYKSIYTKETLESTRAFYFGLLTKESTRQHRVLLFYNNKKETPSSNDLILFNKRLNPSLLGGIEAIQGAYYALIPNRELSRGDKIIQSFKANNENPLENFEDSH